MASEPKRPGDDDNIVSLREARARQAEARAKADKSKPAARSEKRTPVLLVFLGLLAAFVAVKFLLG